MKPHNLTAPKRGFFSRLFRRGGQNQPARRERHYAAVRPNGPLADVRLNNAAADALARADLDRLRSLSRKQARDNDYMLRFLQMVGNHVVGRDGFSLQMQVQLDNGSAMDNQANRAIEEAFAAWARRGVCEVSGLYSFTDLQRLMVRSVARDGEVLVRHVYGFDNGHGYALQLLDIDRLDTQLNRDKQNGKNAIRMGVEINDWGRPVAYWLRRQHPGDYTVAHALLDNERIPAAEISHLYLHDRPEQRRGFPWTTSALISLHNLGGYQEAAIIAARVGASKMGFFQQKEDIDSFQNPIDGQAVDNGHGGQDIIDYADPGTFHSLPNGYEFVPFNPDYPHANYDSFVKTCLRSVAGGLGVSYHNLANDLEGVNFSSIRSGVLEERDQWMALQNWYIDSFLCDVFERWLACALLAGAITSPTGKQLPAAKLDKFKRYRWQGRRWAWVDPLKDIQSQEAAIALRVKSRRAVCDELGVDFDETLQQIQQEAELMQQMGLTETPPTQPAANDEDKGDEQNNRD